jgi:hypothetical protein
MLKYSLIAASVMALLIPTAQAQVGGMSMDEQIARIHQAELEIQALDAAKEQERQAAQKKAADIQRRADQARAKAQAAAQKAKADREKKLQAYDDQARETELESKRLDIELKKAQLELQKKMIEAKANRADEFVQADLDAARAKVQTLKEQSEALQTSVQ